MAGGLRRAWLTEVACRSAVRTGVFFQAEDGIRDLTVTGVQTCALPICRAIGDSQGQPRVRSEFLLRRKLAAVAVDVQSGGTFPERLPEQINTRDPHRH